MQHVYFLTTRSWRAEPRERPIEESIGAQHVGNARTCLITWLSARSQGGRVVRRIEDIDSCGWVDSLEPIRAADLLPPFRLASLPREPFVVTADLLARIGYR